MPRGKRASKGDYKCPETTAFLDHKLKGVLSLLVEISKILMGINVM